MGGIHTELRLPRRRGGQRNHTSPDIVAAVHYACLGRPRRSSKSLQPCCKDSLRLSVTPPKRRKVELSAALNRGDGGKLQAPVHAIERDPANLGIGYVAANEFCRGRQVVAEPGREVIEHADGVTSLEQRPAEMRTDEPAP